MKPRDIALIVCMFISSVALAAAQELVRPPHSALRDYVGFDKNGYPGDDLLPALRKTFTYAGFWLNDPPGMNTNPWAGKRGAVRAAGFGFLILFNGRLDAQLISRDAAALGQSDAAAAVTAAKQEGFPAGAVIFLDQEEGGALLEEQAAYLGAWIADVNRSLFKAGVYCSGIAVAAGPKKMSTAEDIHARFADAKLWVWNDQCPPAPGCLAAATAYDPARSGFPEALAWQYARSPRSHEGTNSCRQTYAADDGCYAPGLPHSPETSVDLDVSRSADPSQGR
ncbi:MAG TPA: glycoside hydrolase domain-containing protein [Acidobacteriaceae bacterium]|jgi:hypothetical protein|nr:glycoside hydrolase domain-containing protein [Acidobacteriaceae bacterium]